MPEFNAILKLSGFMAIVCPFMFTGMWVGIKLAMFLLGDPKSW